MTFDEQRDYIEKNRKVDMKHFNRVSDITMMIDLLNKNREEQINKHAEGEVHEISKFLASIMNRKMFLMGR